eukprot:6471233-Amphidinium_carterae.5
MWFCLFRGFSGILWTFVSELVASTWREPLGLLERIIHDTAVSLLSLWACRIWLAWTQSKILPEVDVLAPTGLLCYSRDEELEACLKHSRPVFQNTHTHTTPGDAEWLLAYVPSFLALTGTWKLMEAELVQTIMQAPNTAVGPFCVPYRPYKPIASIVAAALRAVIRACQERIALPASWKEVVTVFIPKKSDGPLAACDFRPLAGVRNRVASCSVVVLCPSWSGLKLEWTVAACVAGFCTIKMRSSYPMQAPWIGKLGGNVHRGLRLPVRHSSRTKSRCSSIHCGY